MAYCKIGFTTKLTEYVFEIFVTSLILLLNTQSTTKYSPFRVDVIYSLLIRRGTLVTRDLKQNAQDIMLDYTNWQRMAVTKRDLWVTLCC